VTRTGSRAASGRHMVVIAWGVAIALGLSLSSCSGGTSSVTPPAQPHLPPFTYVALGGNESLGNDANDPVRQAFTVGLERQLPRQTVFYDLGAPEATSTDVLQDQVPTTLSLHPNLVTVWVGLSDLEEGVSADEYGARLKQILAELRATHALVLVANIEPITLAPAYRSCLGPPASTSNPRNDRCFVDQFFPRGSLPSVAQTSASIAAYNLEVASVVRSTDATLVDISSAMSGTTAGQAGQLFSSDDFDLSTTGHELTSRLFGEAWRAARSKSASTNHPSR
jgi:lysophospholipase L1-like esterase